MNFKACCGLLAGSKDNEDYDYDDVEDPLPEPQTRAYVQKKAVSRAELREEKPGKSSRRGSDRSATAPHQREQERERNHGVPTMEPLTRNVAGGSSSSGGTNSKGNNNSRPKRRTSRQPLSASTSAGPPLGSVARGAPEDHRQHQGRDYADAARGGAAGGGGGTVEAMRPAPKGAVGMGIAGSSRGAMGAGSRLPSKRGPTTTTTATATSGGGAARGGGGDPGAFDLARFEEKLGGGLIVTKINRQGRAKVRTLFYDSKEKMLWWNEPGGRGNRQRSNSSKSSLLSMSLRKEQPLPVASLVKVEMAEKLDEPFCFDADVDKSFQLVFPARTVDLVAKDAEEAALLARGFQELKLSVSP